MPLKTLEMKKGQVLIDTGLDGRVNHLSTSPI